MSTPLFQEALIEAKKLREAAANEAKNAVLEAVSPIIKQMIDREISGVILEQEEPSASEAAPMDMPPPAPPAPSPDAGTVAPLDAAPPAGAETAPSPMPGMSPAVAKAAPPIVAPEGASVPGKFETDPTTGQPQIVLNINDLFTKTAPEAVAGTETLPTEVPAPESVATPPASLPVEMPPTEEEAGTATPQALAEIYRAVNRLLAEQKKKSLKEQAAVPAPATPAAPAAPVDPNAPVAPIAPVPTAAAPVPTDPNAAPAAPAASAAPGMTPEQMMAPAAPVAPASPPAAAGVVPPAPVDPNAAAAPPAVPAAPAPTAAPPAPVMEYKNFKTNLEKLEQTVNQIGKRGILRSSFIKENHEKEVLSLYKQLVGLRSKNAISSRVFGHNEERLDLLNENLNLIYSYTKNPLTKESTMKTKNSLRDFARSLFEGAEGFEKEAGHVDPAGDSEGGSAEHAHKVSGNPHHVKAEAEKAKFPTKEKNVAWDKAAPSAESLLEQLEEEIAEMMGAMQDEEEGMHMEQDGDSDSADEAVLEMSDEEVMMEARKARARLRKLREQAEEEVDMEEGDDDHLSLTIDLDGVSGEEVENVNVSIDGEELDVDMGGEEDMEMSGEEEAAPEAEEGEEEEEEVGLMEARKAVRSALKPVNENVALRKQLNETQLLTARSLYLNKLFVRDDLSGAQKRKIVEYLDSARTIAEAKEIYNRVTRVLNTAKKSGVVTESAARPAAMLNEAVEPSFDTARWQILAGVKKTAK